MTTNSVNDLKKARLTDVAALANVSVSTVDRVLNRRETVSAKSRRRVLDAINELNYRDLERIRHGALGKPVRLASVIPAMNPQFSTELDFAHRNLSKRMPAVTIQMHRNEYALNEAHAKLPAILDQLSEKTDGVALVVPNIEPVRMAVDRLVDRGIQVVTIMSDLPETARHDFVSTCNQMAGRTAAAMMAMLVKAPKGKVISIYSCNRFTSQWERHAGFAARLPELAKNLRIAAPVEISDATDQATDLVHSYLEKNRDIVGAYISGGSISGAVRAINEFSAKRTISTVITDMRMSSCNWLKTGEIDAIIRHDLTDIAHIALTKLVNAIAGTNYKTVVENSPIEIILPDNVVSYERRTSYGQHPV